jgi:IS1 family transposase
VLVTARRDAATAHRFIRRALATLKVRPTEVITDAAPVYPAVLDELVPSAWHHVERYANNRVEADHSQLKHRLRPMRGPRTDRTAQTIIAGHTFMQPIREPDLTVGPVVFTEPIVMAMSTTDPLAQQDSVSLEAFADRTVIVGAAPDYWRHTPASPTRSSATHHSPVSRLSGAPPPKPISSEPLPASSPSWAR